MKRDAIDVSHIVGKGQLEKLKATVSEKDIKLVVFDLNNVKPAQVRNLEEYLKCRVVGRTEVILDIFARRARSAESKIQVELAQLNYILPRLKGLGGVLSRLGGGIGTRGPGEKMLETDRRHVLRRITKLKQKLKKISRHRELIRKSRSDQLRGAVVGYTNAGKSTLLNSLARDDLFVEDRLFATLDAYTRVVYLDDSRKVLMTDTVGFINNLPSNLVESFKSTLEEIRNAHFLVHVVDITSRDIDAAIKTVTNELRALDCGEKETLLFFNKADLIRDDTLLAETISNRFPDAIIGSAADDAGTDILKRRIIEIYDTVKSKECQDSDDPGRNCNYECF
ncbi:MAG TPA: GTPase HflX [Spirochaetes bacterium]|nr:GTPase HflX [Spirochaetota bacterium]